MKKDNGMVDTDQAQGTATLSQTHNNPHTIPLTKLANGNDSVWSTLVKLIRPQVSLMLSINRFYSEFYKMLEANARDAEDMVMTEIYFSLTKKGAAKARSLASQPYENFRAWTYKTAWGHARHLLEKEFKHSNRILSGYQPEVLDAIHEDYLNKNAEQHADYASHEEYQNYLTKLVDENVANLPCMQRMVSEALLDPANLGRKHKDVAQDMGLSQNSFNRSYFSAVNNLEKSGQRLGLQ